MTFVLYARIVKKFIANEDFLIIRHPVPTTKTSLSFDFTLDHLTKTLHLKSSTGNGNTRINVDLDANSITTFFSCGFISNATVIADSVLLLCTLYIHFCKYSYKCADYLIFIVTASSEQQYF